MRLPASRSRQRFDAPASYQAHLCLVLRWWVVALKIGRLHVSPLGVSNINAVANEAHSPIWMLDKMYVEERLKAEIVQEALEKKW